MRRKLAVATVISVIGILGASGTAFANDCVNLSRPFNPNTQEGEVQGRWLPIDEPFLGGETWLFLSPDNFMNGQGDALLANATCPAGRLVGQSKGNIDPANLHGIWSEECFDKASGAL
jgi:hypothetical protein